MRKTLLPQICYLIHYLGPDIRPPRRIYPRACTPVPYYIVVQKMSTLLFYCSFNKRLSISTIFGTQYTEEIFSVIIIHLSTSSIEVDLIALLTEQIG